MRKEQATTHKDKNVMKKPKIFIYIFRLYCCLLPVLVYWCVRVYGCVSDVFFIRSFFHSPSFTQPASVNINSFHERSTRSFSLPSHIDPLASWSICDFLLFISVSDMAEWFKEWDTKLMTTVYSMLLATRRLIHFHFMRCHAKPCDLRSFILCDAVRS